MKDKLKSELMMRLSLIRVYQTEATRALVNYEREPSAKTLQALLEAKTALAVHTGIIEFINGVLKYDE